MTGGETEGLKGRKAPRGAKIPGCMGRRKSLNRGSDIAMRVSETKKR